MNKYDQKTCLHDYGNTEFERGVLQCNLCGLVLPEKPTVMNNWQPIETAPRDGSRIKAKTADDNEIFVQWRDHDNIPPKYPCGWVDDYGFMRQPDRWFQKQD